MPSRIVALVAAMVAVVFCTFPATAQRTDDPSPQEAPYASAPTADKRVLVVAGDCEVIPDRPQNYDCAGCASGCQGTPLVEYTKAPAVRRYVASPGTDVTCGMIAVKIPAAGVKQEVCVNYSIKITIKDLFQSTASPGMVTLIGQLRGYVERVANGQVIYQVTNRCQTQGQTQTVRIGNADFLVTPGTFGNPTGPSNEGGVTVNANCIVNFRRQ